MGLTGQRSLLPKPYSSSRSIAVPPNSSSPSFSLIHQRRAPAPAYLSHLQARSPGRAQPARHRADSDRDGRRRAEQVQSRQPSTSAGTTQCVAAAARCSRATVRAGRSPPPARVRGPGGVRGGGGLVWTGAAQRWRGAALDEAALAMEARCWAAAASLLLPVPPTYVHKCPRLASRVGGPLPRVAGSSYSR